MEEDALCGCMSYDVFPVPGPRDGGSEHSQVATEISYFINAHWSTSKHFLD